MSQSSPAPNALLSQINILLLLFVSMIVGQPVGLSAESPAPGAPANVRPFFTTYCLDCHQGDEAEAKLDLASLGSDLDDKSTERHWIRLIERVRDREMPPKSADQPSAADLASFVNSSSQWLSQYQMARAARQGRVPLRRLTRREVERSLQDLLGIDIPLADQLPEDSRTAGFTTVADGQAMSHFQLERHLAVVDVALDEAFRRVLSPEDHYERDFDAAGVARKDPGRRTREPELRDGQAVVWSGGVTFYGRIPATSAPESGLYRFTVRVSGLKLPETGGVWTTVRSGLCVSSAPLLTYITAFEAQSTPRDITFEAWLPEDHMLEIRPADATLKKGKFAGGQIGTGEGEPQNVPGIAIDRITMQRIHRGSGSDEIHKHLFGDLKVVPGAEGRPARVLSRQPPRDVSRLIAAFATRAFRKPVAAGDLKEYTAFALQALKEHGSLIDALRVGYRAILCSPRFLYFQEQPGTLDDYAIATRLSYFLTGSTPDRVLMKLADQRQLRNPATIREQAERLLAGSGGRRFVNDFADQWLDLDQIDFTQPDTKLFPEFDAIVQHSMLEETQTYLHTMLRDNLNVTALIESDFSMLNSRLARYYDIKGVTGDELRRVKLQAQDHRGGVLTQGAILKVTANGSNTSPVVRGVWVSERLLGVPIPPPPGNVPAIEPDIRGAKTIREQLAKHRSDASCAVCHVKIDPPGFALENFDPAGQWRNQYESLVDGKLKRGATVDASYILTDGRPFDDVDEFQSLITTKPEQLASNVVEKLLTYGTGAPVSFADQSDVATIVDATAQDNYGLRSLILAVVTSPTFLNK